MVDYEYIKKILKKNGFKLSDVSGLLEIQYQTLYKNLNDSKSLDTIFRIAQITNINFFELLTPPEGFAHFYDPNSGKWLGIREK